jgi:hypothetical protein
MLLCTGPIRQGYLLLALVGEGMLDETEVESNRLGYSVDLNAHAASFNCFDLSFRAANVELCSPAHYWCLGFVIAMHKFLLVALALLAHACYNNQHENKIH